MPDRQDPKAMPTIDSFLAAHNKKQFRAEQRACLKSQFAVGIANKT